MNIPPPPPKKSKKLPATKKHKHEIVMPPKHARTRMAIFKIYNTYIRTQGASLEWCWQTTIMSDDPEGPKAQDWVSLDSVRDHAHQEKWREERDAMWADVRKQVTSAAKIEIVEAEVKEMGELTKMQDDLKVAMVDTKPSSLDAGIRAYIALDKRIGEKRSFVVDRVSSLTPPPPVEGKAAPGLVAPDVADNLEEAEVLKFAVEVTTARAGMNMGQRALETTANQDGVDDAEHDDGEEP